MLTDIFARRYENRPIFSKVTQAELKLLVQASRVISEQVLPYYDQSKKVNEKAKRIWTDLHDRLSMELGVKELSPRYYSYVPPGHQKAVSGWFEMDRVCDRYITASYQEEWDEDVFMKNRLSFVELAFREREQQIAEINAELPGDLMDIELMEARLRASGFGGSDNGKDRAIKANERINHAFGKQVHELNTRFAQAGAPLHYHNGYIQIKTDDQLQAQIEAPFWLLVKDAKWSNVSTDMAEAVDRRDTAGRDPALYAAKALESTIKIICDDKKWTTGKEKGASDFLNHLEMKANGPFVEPWERTLMQRFFSDVRNHLGHGPGSSPMPALTEPQTDFAIEFCMSWVKSLIKRL